jgi:hypothetical protein
MERKVIIQDVWDSTLDMQWMFDDSFDRCFLDPKEVERLLGNISILRKHKFIDVHERQVIMSIVNLGRKRYKEFQEKLINEPRRLAQKFIGNKKIREFIFTRDGYSCLNCGIDYSLSIDHIVPVSKDGGNCLSNLQTLCSRCNSSKGSKIIDYRKGGTL